MNFPSHNSLYLITSEPRSAGRTTLEIAEAAISAGIDIIQMREKNLSYDQLKQLGKKLSTMCKTSSIVFIANDNPVLAKEIDADGVHLGQEDMQKWPPAKAREILGSDKIIGISTHSLKDVEQANKLDINYIAFGPIFATKTKNYSIGTKDIKKVLTLSKFPVVCIGGVTEANIKIILQLGCSNIAMIGEITESENVYNKVRKLKNIISLYHESHH